MSDRSKIEAAKRALPLPDLLRKLGFNPPASGAGNMPSPFAPGRPQKTPSFSIFQRGEAWGWVDRSSGVESKGDEITLLEKLEGLSPADAIVRYVDLAGVENAPPARVGRGAEASGKSITKRKVASRHSSDHVVIGRVELDWPAAVLKFSDDQANELARWRGISPEFVAWLRDQALVGLCKESTAFPVHGTDGRVIAAHIRPKSGRWFYWPKGAGCQPLIIGDLATATRTMVFESQWDAFAIMDAAGWHKVPPDGWAVLVTRGASNGRLAARAAGAVYAWPQNDPEKNGHRAGEEWLRDVAAHAPGIVLSIATPGQWKDANDWTRAEAIDVWAAVEAATSVPRPEKPPINTRLSAGGALNDDSKVIELPNNQAPIKTSSSGGAVPVSGATGGEPPPRPEFDPGAVMEDLGLYWLNGSPSYFLRRAEDGRLRFLEMGASEVRRKLRVRGFRVRPDPDAGESVSQIDRVLDAATETRAVDFAVSIGGTHADVYKLAGGSVLVRDSPHLVAPQEGDFQTIETFLAALLGDDVMRFCCWLKVGYEALRAGERRPGQALIIIGPPDCGKSRIQHQIITPMLAGRSADPKSFFFGRTDFNAELIGAEHLLIEEVPSSSRHEERLFFGERIKEIVANDTARLHKKNRDAVTVSPFWRLSITLNDNPEKLRCLPPLTDDLADKIIMLQAQRAPQFWAQFEDQPDPRKAFREAINRELPAFADFLLTMPIPPQMLGRRYGVASFIPEELALTIFEGEPEHHLMLLIDKGLVAGFDDDGLWKGDSEDLKQALCGESSSVRGSAVRLLGGVQASTLGIWLAHLAAKFPARVRKHRTADKREWIISRGAA